MNYLINFLISFFILPEWDREIKLLIVRFPAVGSIFHHAFLPSCREVPHGVCSVLRCHNQMLMVAVNSRRAEVVELEVCEARASLIEASPFDISPFANPAPQECGTLQLITHHVEKAGIFWLAPGLLPLRWWGVDNEGRSLNGILWCLRWGLLHFFLNSALKSVVYNGTFYTSF